jgi:hypothetical protein
MAAKPDKKIGQRHVQFTYISGYEKNSKGKYPTKTFTSDAMPTETYLKIASKFAVIDPRKKQIQHFKGSVGTGERYKNASGYAREILKKYGKHLSGKGIEAVAKGWADYLALIGVAKRGGGLTLDPNKMAHTGIGKAMGGKKGKKLNIAEETSFALMKFPIMSPDRILGLSLIDVLDQGFDNNEEVEEEGND